MNKEIRLEIVEELSHFCYICHKQFFLMCGEPQIKMGGCCSGAVWGKVRYIRPVYAHLPCFQAKEVKRRETIYKLPVIRKIMGGYAKQEIKSLNNLLRVESNPVSRGLITADRKRFKAWLEELRC